MTGHSLTKHFQAQKALIKQFAKENDIELSETTETLILSKNEVNIEIKPKSKTYRDINTNLSYDYCNSVACLKILFGCYKVH